jgi:hypothetical protein
MRQRGTEFHRGENVQNKALLGKQAEADLNKLFVWMRLSALKQLTWQRNYNTKPKDLAAAQQTLTLQFADFYKADPSLRSVMQVGSEWRFSLRNHQFGLSHLLASRVPAADVHGDAGPWRRGWRRPEDPRRHSQHHAQVRAPFRKPH